MHLWLKKNSGRFLFLLLILGLALPLSAAGVASQGRPDSLADLAARLKPAVVNISTTQIVRFTPQPFGIPFPEGSPMEEYFRRFFGPMPERELKRQSLGSGFIISPDGFILTNNHVVGRATEIKVILEDKREFQARLIGRDPKTDLALIKIEAEGPLPAATLGDSDSLRVGDWVVAIGNPFGLGHTVTAGIVSAKGRIIGAGPYDDFIQTDASINPGNSGGPLFNLKGEVVGVNTAIVASGQGIGFAIPIKIAKELLPSLKRGEVTRGYLGVYLADLTPEQAKSVGLKEGRGVLVVRVVRGGPAERANLQPGDIVVRFDGKEVPGTRDLSWLVATTPPGKEVEVEVIRRGKPLTLRVIIGRLEEERRA